VVLQLKTPGFNMSGKIVPEADAAILRKSYARVANWLDFQPDIFGNSVARPKHEKHAKNTLGSLTTP
jgi:hypothetical protein